MGRLFFLTAVLSFLAHASMGLCADVIRLKSGAAFTVDQYWYEDNQIRFYLYGGTVGIDKKEVLDIRQAAEAKNPGAPATIRHGSAETKIALPPEADADSSSGAIPASEDRMAKWQAEKREIQQQINQVLASLDRAQTVEDQAEVKQLQQQFMSLKAKELKLRDEVRAFTGGTLPEWWENQ